MTVSFCSKNHCGHNCPHWLEEEDPEIDWSEIDGFLTEPEEDFFRVVTANMVSVEEDGQEIMTWEDNPSEEPRENLKPVPPTDDEVRQVDLGTEGDPRPIFLSASLSSEEAEQYVQLLKEYLDIFAWSYAEMPGLDPEIAVHRLNIKPDAKLSPSSKRNDAFIHSS